MRVITLTFAIIPLWSLDGFSQAPLALSNDWISPEALRMEQAASKAPKVLLQMRDGSQRQGSLSSVRGDSIELDAAVIPRGDIAVIRIHRPSKAGLGAAIGFGVGAAFGIWFYSYFTGGADTPFDTSDFILATSAFGTMGAVPGAMLGAAAGADQQYDLTGREAGQRWQSFLQDYGGSQLRK